MFCSKNLSKFSEINHGFFTRLNGFSKKEFTSLNCSISSGDNKKIVYKNRYKALKKLKLHKKKLILINQIHSSKVIEIKKSNLETKNFFSKLGIFLIG